MRYINEARATIANLNRYIQNNYGKGIELMKGSGYFYFMTNNTGYDIPESIYIYSLSQAPYEKWIKYIDDSLQDAGYQKLR